MFSYQNDITISQGYTSLAYSKCLQIKIKLINIINIVWLTVTQEMVSIIKQCHFDNYTTHNIY